MEEEEIQHEVAQMHKKKWICFAIVTAAVAVLVGICIGMSYVFYKTKVNLDHNTGFVWLVTAGTLLGCYALFVTVDTLSYYHSIPIKMLKTVLRVGALVWLLILDLLLLLVLSGTGETNPWVIGLFSMDLLGNVLTILAYYWNEKVKKTDYNVDRAMIFSKGYPYIPLASQVIGYFLSVLFAYLGKTVHSFFYGGFGAVLCLLAIVASIVVYCKKFKRRRGYGRRTYSGSYSSGNGTTKSSSGATNDTEERKADEGHKVGYRRMSAITLRSNEFVASLPIGVDRVEWVKTLSIGNSNYWASSGSISFRGGIRCHIRKESEDYADDLSERVLKDVISNIKNAAEQVLDDLATEYLGYDRGYTFNWDGMGYSYKIV
ncbi:MAG: hypothetical protein K2M95_01345 [Clostridiales bacterium]|nr:hypothetical protein [Clostridiales bacterium]